ILVPQLKCTECVLQRFHLNGLDGKVTILLKVVIPRKTMDDPALENELVAYKLNLKIANGQDRCFSAVSDYRDELPDGENFAKFSTRSDHTRSVPLVNASNE
ncbi:hypothetical protein PHET_08600, partial [Paragonimus heterotremus]